MKAIQAPVGKHHKLITLSHNLYVTKYVHQDFLFPEYFYYCLWQDLTEDTEQQISLEFKSQQVYGYSTTRFVTINNSLELRHDCMSLYTFVMQQQIIM